MVVVVVLAVCWSNAAVSAGHDLSECRQSELTVDVTQ